jgi:hypothetical protein
MKTNHFNEEFFANVRETEVWKQLSEDRDFVWTDTLIERYQGKIDWKLLSSNSNVQWTGAMLEKYKDKLDWEALSYSNCHYLFSAEMLRKFSSRWNWSRLSSNSSVKWTMDKVDEFKDLIDWEEFVDEWYDEQTALDFFERFKEYLPVATLQQSRLWRTIIEIYKERLIEEILSR